jgi:uncharacterized protein (UPF0218 family)
MNLLLPIERRSDLKKPLGKLLRGDIKDNLLILGCIISKKDPPKFATVGDYVSKHIIKGKLHPDIVIIDHRIMREDVEPLDLEREKLYVKNPPGSITIEAQKILHEAITFNKKMGIVVEGEEDLLVLPLMAMMPIASVIVYGQPSEGMVVVTLTEERRRWAKNFMTIMEEEGTESRTNINT